MTEALRHPPRGFEDLAREHLWRKKWHILEVVGGWLREGRSPGGLPGHYRGEPPPPPLRPKKNTSGEPKKAEIVTVKRLGRQKSGVQL